MRKFVLSAVAALGFLAIGLTVLGHPAMIRQADADGSGADVRMTRHHLVALTDPARSRPLFVDDTARSTGTNDQPTVLV